LSLALGLMSCFCFAQSTSQSPPQSAAASSATASPGATTAPSPPNALGDAQLLYRQRKFAEAIAKYQEYLMDHPQSPDAYAGMVRAYLKERNFEQAAQTAEQGLALSDSARIRVARAEVWFRQGRISDAEVEWVKTINSGYPDARAYLGLARVRHALAMYKTAKKMIDKARQMDPDDPDIQNEWMTTLSWDERVQSVKAVLASDTDPAKHAGDTKHLEVVEGLSKQKQSPCRLVSKATSTRIEMIRLLRDANHLRGFGLPVVLNGHKSSLRIDTGASGILVKRSIAEHAGVSKMFENKIAGVGSQGVRSAFLATAESLKIGDLEFQNCPVEVMENNNVVDEDGLIGTNVFQQFLVDLDFPHEKLKLSELPKRPDAPEQNLSLTSDSGSAQDEAEPLHDRYIAPEMKSYTPIFRFGHDLLVPTTIGQATAKLFILDTGAFNNSISPAAAREITKVNKDDRTTIKGLSGSVDKVFSANKAVIQFGHLRQENQDMIAFDTTGVSESIGTEVSGFLGFAMLRFIDVKIDYRDALVDFEYDPKFWNLR
jgi:tetratricopeptide (TPR) repeat protein